MANHVSPSFDAHYLGGHPRYSTHGPVKGGLCFDEKGITFLVMGEFLEPLFTVSWTEVDAWEVSGPELPQMRSSGGRTAVGALLAGIPGAIVGLAAAKETFSTVLAVRFDGNLLAFVIRDLAPPAVTALIRAIPGTPEPGSDRAESVSATWQHRIIDIDELPVAGSDGWEAVGVWTEHEVPRFLMKRPGSWAPKTPG